MSNFDVRVNYDPALLGIPTVFQSVETSSDALSSSSGAVPHGQVWLLQGVDVAYATSGTNLVAGAWAFSPAGARFWADSEVNVAPKVAGHLQWRGALIYRYPDTIDVFASLDVPVVFLGITTWGLLLPYVP